MTGICKFPQRSSWETERKISGDLMTFKVFLGTVVCSSGDNDKIIRLMMHKFQLVEVPRKYAPVTTVTGISKI